MGSNDFMQNQVNQRVFTPLVSRRISKLTAPFDFLGVSRGAASLLPPCRRTLSSMLSLLTGPWPTIGILEIDSPFLFRIWTWRGPDEKEQAA